MFRRSVPSCSARPYRPLERRPLRPTRAGIVAAAACAIVSAGLTAVAPVPSAATVPTSPPTPVVSTIAAHLVTGDGSPGRAATTVTRPRGSLFLSAHDLRVVRRRHVLGMSIAAALASIRRHRSPAVKAATRPTASMVPSYGGACSWWTVQWAPDVDGSGRVIPTRCGDSTFGWTKIVTKHGIVNMTLVQRLYQQQPTKIVGTQLEYDGFVVQSSDLSVVLPLRAVVETTGYSLRRGESSPDGMILGTNTVYCLTGATLCPAWINLL